MAHHRTRRTHIRLTVGLLMILVTCVAGSGLLAAGASGMIGGITQNPEPPWAVRLDLDGQPNCTAALIAPTWVITAGHCLLGYSASRIGVDMRGVSFTAQQVFVHPQYTTRTVQ